MRALSLPILTSLLASAAAPALADVLPPPRPAPTAESPLRQLSDADLVAYAAKPFDKAAMMFKQVRLGMNHGLVVLVDFPCSDICPDYTTRIIHYELGPGPACLAAGGANETRAVPYSIAVVEKEFCVPKVLAPHA